MKVDLQAFYFQPPSPIPLSMPKAVKSKLGELEQVGIKEKVPIVKPIPRCSPLSCLPKKKWKC